MTAGILLRYGESQKLATAVFTLAVKLQPCIIFIDEIDSFLRTRNSADHEATAMMKALFMSLWDGLMTDSNCTVIVMGATNRPMELDSAILRRMPASFRISLPNVFIYLFYYNFVVSNEGSGQKLVFHVRNVYSCDINVR